jgi:hypothetical protein
MRSYRVAKLCSGEAAAAELVEALVLSISKGSAC